ERGSHLIDLHLFRVRRSDGHVDNHIVSGGAHQPGEPETAVVNGVKNGALGRQRVIQAVDIHTHPHFRNAAYQRHSTPSCYRSCSCSLTSCWDAPAPHLRSFNGNCPDKSSGVAASGVAALARGGERHLPVGKCTRALDRHETRHTSPSGNAPGMTDAAH